MARKKNGDVHDEVRARRIVIVDREGKEVAKIASERDGVTFDMWDGEGNRRVRLKAGPGTTTFTLHRPDQQGKISLESARDYMNLCFHVGKGDSKTPLYLVVGDDSCGLSLVQPGSSSFMSFGLDPNYGYYMNIGDSKGSVVFSINGGDYGSSLRLSAPLRELKIDKKRAQVPEVSASITASPEGVQFEAKGPNNNKAILYLDAPADEEPGRDEMGLLLGQSHGLVAELKVTPEESSNEACFGIWDPEGNPRVQIFYSNDSDVADLYVTNTDVDDELIETRNIYRTLKNNNE